MSNPSSPAARAAALVLVVAAVAAPSRAAFAQTSGEKAAAAQALFDEAMRLVKAGQAADACPKLEESQRLDAGMATQFRLAECYERVGKLASAWASFVAVADAAAVARLPERESAARTRAHALAPRLVHLTITVPPAVAALEGVEIQRDGTPVARALWGVPVPVDPGDHHVTVRAPGKQPWEGRVTSGDTAGALTLDVALLQDRPQDALPLPPPSPSAARARSAVPAIVLGVVAAAAAGTGVGLFVAHSGQATDASSLSAQIKVAHGTCAAGAPAPSGLCGMLASKAQSSDTLGNASTVAFAAAGAAAVAMVGYLVWPRSTEPRTGTHRLRLAPVVGAGQGGVMAGGSF
jgi:hypothetical protein